MKTLSDMTAVILRAPFPSRIPDCMGWLATLGLVVIAGYSGLHNGSVHAAAAHPISVTETDVFVTRTRAIVRIQIFAEDLMLFQGLEPNEQDRISPDDLRRGLEQHRQFLLDKVTLRDAAGERISGSVTDLKPFQIAEDGIVVSDLMLHTATYQLEFPFEQPPEYLTIQQDISDENFIFPSEMKLSVHQTGSDLTFTESLKAGAAVTLRFDWSSAPLSESATDEDWEKWFEKQREATLGITSYSSIYSFIYIEPTEVRHEVLIPLASLKTILPLKHQDPAFIEVSEQDGVRDLIRSWLKDVNPVTINGIRVPPEFTRIDFYGLDLKDFARQAESRRVSLASGRAGIILTYRRPDDFVRDLKLTWDKYHQSIRRIQSVVFAWPDKTERFEFSRFNKPEDNCLTWSCPPERQSISVQGLTAEVAPKPELKIPVVSAGLCLAALAGALFLRRSRIRAMFCTAAILAALLLRNVVPVSVPHPWKAIPEVTPHEAGRIVERLQENNYRALDFGSDRRIYEALAISVDGSLLEELFLQLRQSLEMREQGGAVARVRSVEFSGFDSLPRSNDLPAWPGFACRSQWTVSGTVEHWGHVHERRNQFDALFHVEPRDGHWKMTRMDIEEQKQLSQKTSLRKF